MRWVKVENSSIKGTKTLQKSENRFIINSRHKGEIVIMLDEVKTDVREFGGDERLNYVLDTRIIDKIIFELGGPEKYSWMVKVTAKEKQND